MSTSDQENSFHVYGGNCLRGGSLARQRGLRRHVSKAAAIDVHDAHSEGRERADSSEGFFLVSAVQTDGVPPTYRRSVTYRQRTATESQ